MKTHKAKDKPSFIMSRGCVCTKGAWEQALQRLHTELVYVIKTEPLYYNVEIDPDRIQFRPLAHSVLERMCAQARSRSTGHITVTPWLQGMPLGLFLARSLGMDDADAKNPSKLLESVEGLPSHLRKPVEKVVRRWAQAWFGDAVRGQSLRDLTQKIMQRESKGKSTSHLPMALDQEGERAGKDGSRPEEDDDDDDDDEEEEEEDDEPPVTGGVRQ